MARPLLRKLGKAILGGIANRVQGQPSGGLLARIRDEPATVPVNPAAPAVTRGWDAPEWLVLLLRIIVAGIDRFTGRAT